MSPRYFRGGRVGVKKDLDPVFARRVAEDFLEGTRDLYARAEIAGSLRRDEPVVHDIDIAVIPKDRDYEAWRGEVRRRVEKMRGEVMSFGEVISNFAFEGVQVNLFICPGANSWGVTLMWATGPKGHTIGMTIKARDRGMIINSQGIWTRNEPRRLMPARTEEAVGRILDWKYKPPRDRGKPAKKEPSFL